MIENNENAFESDQNEVRFRSSKTDDVDSLLKPDDPSPSSVPRKTSQFDLRDSEELAVDTPDRNLY